MAASTRISCSFPRSADRRTWPAPPPVRCSSSTASTSARVVVCPRVNRSDPRARWSSYPMASRTWLGSATPALHADPVETSIPRASSSSNSESPSQSLKDKCALSGKRPSGHPTAARPRRCSRHRSISASRSSLSRRASSAWCLIACSTATANPAVAGASSVPDRTSRSWPPPCRIGVSFVSLWTISAPIPYGPPSLCAGHRHRVHAQLREVHRHLPDRLDRVGVHGDLVLAGQRRDLPDRLDRPDLVVRHHQRDEGHGLRVLLDRPPYVVRLHPAELVDGQPLDLGASRAAPATRPDRVRRGARSPLSRIRRRRGSSARRAHHRPFRARLSASVPPEVKTTSLGWAPSAAAIVSRDSSTVRRAARPEPCRDDALPVRAR